MRVTRANAERSDLAEAGTEGEKGRRRNILKPPLHILHLEDDLNDAALVQAALEAEGISCAITCVQRRADFVAALQGGGIDLVLADFSMPEFDGWAALEIVRSEWPSLPFIHVSGTLGEEKAIDSLKNGATDYVLKERLSRLAPAVRRAMQEVEERAERRRLEQEMVLQAKALTSVANGIMITNSEGTILWINPAFAALTGYSEQQAIGKNPRILKSGKHDPAFYRSLWQTIRAGETWRGEITNRRKDGSLYCGEQTITPIRSNEGDIAHFIAVMNDVTERKRLEAQLIEAQKMEVLGRLASGVAHDFNNILGVIMGYGDLLTAELGPDDPRRKYIEEIGNASDRAAGLTRQLLVFSRKELVQPVVLDLNGVVRAQEKMLRRLIGENIEMSILPSEQACRIKADSGYIGQVMMNLAVNARDAMPNGGKLVITTGTVVIDRIPDRSHKGAIPGDYVVLSVSDTGMGMTDVVMAHLFEALFTTKPAGQGTGLGLATCKAIVQQSGGHITVESVLGRGTTFKVYFPRVDSDVEPSSSHDSLKKAPLPRGVETLMLVEDEPSVRHLASRALEAQGYTVLRANNGQDGLLVAREHKGTPIRLVITDVIMPRMGGKVMAEWLKATYPDLKILFTSGYTDDAIAHHGVLDAGVEFLAKPYTTATLVRRVRAVLDTETDACLRKQNVTANQSLPGSK